MLSWMECTSKSLLSVSSTLRVTVHSIFHRYSSPVFGERMCHRCNQRIGFNGKDKQTLQATRSFILYSSSKYWIRSIAGLLFKQFYYTVSIQSRNSNSNWFPFVLFTNYFYCKFMLSYKMQQTIESSAINFIIMWIYMNWIIKIGSELMLVRRCHAY